MSHTRALFLRGGLLIVLCATPVTPIAGSASAAITADPPEATLKAMLEAVKIKSYVKTQLASAVWFVVGWGYRTHRAVCGPLRDQLIARFGPPVTVLDGSGRGFERDVLERFGR